MIKINYKVCDPHVSHESESDLRVVQEWYKIIKYLNKEFGGHTPEIDRIVAEKINQVMVETISQM